MSIPVIQIGDPRLLQKSHSIKKIHISHIQKTIDILTEIMREKNLIGMAACQIGENINLFVTEIRKTKFRNENQIDTLRIYINPTITWFSKKQVVMYEGCGSVIESNIFAPVKRPEKIIIEALNEQGVKFKMKASGLLSRVIQHEYDHLQGILFTQKIHDTRKIMNSEEYIKMISQKE